MSVFPVRASGDKNVLKHIFPTKQADIHSVLLKQEIDKKGVLIYDGQNL
ncbi:hypothetical protein [Ruminococcus sp.]